MLPRCSRGPWFVAGGVIHGEKRGRELGYPTANIRLDKNCGLKHGIYAVRVRPRCRRFDGVASFGRRPTFDNGRAAARDLPVQISGIYGSAPCRFIAHRANGHSHRCAGAAMIDTAAQRPIGRRRADGVLKAMSDRVDQNLDRKISAAARHCRRSGGDRSWRRRRSARHRGRPAPHRCRA